MQLSVFLLQEEQLTITQQQLEFSEREKQTVRQQLQSRNQVRNTISVVHPKRQVGY